MWPCRSIFRRSGGQFDDDLNTATRVLPKYTVVNLSVSRQLGQSAEIFVSGQNLFDKEFYVGTLPTLVGMPRLVTAGFRVRVRGR